MAPTDEEFAAIMEGSKLIAGDITWEWRDQARTALIFKTAVESEVGEELVMHGHYIPDKPSLTFALIHEGARRIYGLDMGRNHRDAQNRPVGTLHKHFWSEQYMDEREAYVPVDITAPASEPLAVWGQFCEEANIEHTGVMVPPQSRLEETA